jgi:predicted MFS family arabinose efflux permease
VGFVSFVVLYAVDSGISESGAGLLLAAVSVGSAVVRVVLGLHADRSGQEALRPLAAMLALSAGAYLLLIAGEPLPVIAAALLAGVFGWSWPGALNLAVVQRCPDAPAWAVGVMMAGLFAGGVAGPLAVGVLAEHDAFAVAWVVCAACALLAAATVTAVQRHEAR